MILCIYLIEAPLGGVPPPPLVVADPLQKLLFWKVPDKFLSSSCQPHWAAGARWEGYRKTKRTKCSVGKPSWQVHDSELILPLRHSQAYLVSAWLGGKCPLRSLFGKGMIGMHIWQVHDCHAYLALIFGKCTSGMHMWQVHGCDAHLASEY